MTVCAHHGPLRLSRTQDGSRLSNRLPLFKPVGSSSLRSHCSNFNRNEHRTSNGLLQQRDRTKRLFCQASTKDPEGQKRALNIRDSAVADQAQTRSEDTEMPRWQVPWGAGQVSTLMIQIWALEAISVPLLTQLRGLSLAETSFSDKALTAAAVQFLKLVGALLIVRRALKPYQPLPPNWYKYKLGGEAVGLGVSGGVTALCLTLLSAAATGGSAAQNTGTVKILLGDGQATTVASIAFASVLGAPLLEEYTYRGFLLPSLTKWLPTPAAVLAQAIIFAASHLSAGDLVPLTALGVTLGTVTVAAEGNVVAPILAHALCNGAILYSIAR